VKDPFDFLEKDRIHGWFPLLPVLAIFRVKD
jgi:hypothetical protein